MNLNVKATDFFMTKKSQFEMKYVIMDFLTRKVFVFKLHCNNRELGTIRVKNQFHIFSSVSNFHYELRLSFTKKYNLFWFLLREEN